MRSRRQRRLWGVDFSGARDAGKAIWIAEGCLERGALRINRCVAMADEGRAMTGPVPCCEALASLIAANPDSLFGCDFPFSLPRQLIPDDSWEEFVLAFPRRFASAEDFRRSCHDAAGGRELRRPTDRVSRTPFSAYNIRIYRQTFHGIANLLHALVRDRLGAILPMQSARPDRAWLIEVCPASTLKSEGLYGSYKGCGADRALARRRILHGLVDRRLLHPLPRPLESTVLRNVGGDALDSVIAAVAGARALRSGRTDAVDPAESLEGRVYY